MIKLILFDWGGTLGLEHERNKLLNSITKEEALQYVYPDAEKTLEYLSKRYILGIVSNTTFTSDDMDYILRLLDWKHYFNYESYSSESCKKPCSQIFNNILKKTNYLNNEICYVGNNYYKDILPQKNKGFFTIYFHKNDFIHKNNIINVSDRTINNISDIINIL
jgi:HAD superfamily hydrolase (TIGR01549 family)